MSPHTSSASCFSLLQALIQKEFIVKYKQSYLGALWFLLLPLGTVAALTGVQMVVGIPTEGVPYPLFSFAGVLPWSLLASSVSAAAPAFVQNAAIIKKIALPRHHLVLASLAVAAANFLLTFGIYAVLAGRYGFWFSAKVLFLVPVVGLELLLIAGLSLGIASLAAFRRDALTALPVGLQMGLWVSPVLYPLSVIPETWRWLYALNPMVGFIQSFRSCLLHDSYPPAWPITVSVLASIAVFAGGWWLFRRLEPVFADVL